MKIAYKSIGISALIAIILVAILFGRLTYFEFTKAEVVINHAVRYDTSTLQIASRAFIKRKDWATAGKLLDLGLKTNTSTPSTKNNSWEMGQMGNIFFERSNATAELNTAVEQIEHAIIWYEESLEKKNNSKVQANLDAARARLKYLMELSKESSSEEDKSNDKDDGSESDEKDGENTGTGSNSTGSGSQGLETDSGSESSTSSGSTSTGSKDEELKPGIPGATFNNTGTIERIPGIGSSGSISLSKEGRAAIEDAIQKLRELQNRSDELTRPDGTIAPNTNNGVQGLFEKFFGDSNFSDIQNGDENDY